MDERRRRRLAQEAEQHSAHAAKLSNSHWPEAAFVAAGPGAASGVRIPLNKFISPRLWKLWLVASVGVLIAAGVICAGLESAGWKAMLGPGLSQLIDPLGGPLPRMYACLMFLLSGQLTLLILWTRSCNQQDFDGRYRRWGWIVMVWFGAAFCLATGAHQAASESLAYLAPAGALPRADLYWLIPALAIGAHVAWLLRREMRPCRSSRWLLRLAACLFTVAVAQLIAPNLQWPALVEPAVLMGGSLCLFVGMLLHARYVVYVSSDPPASRPFRLPIRLPRLRLPRLRLPRVSFSLPRIRLPKRNRAAKQPKAGDTRTISAKPKSEKAQAAAEARGRQQPSAGSRKAPPPQMEHDDDGRQFRVDGPDPQLLRGLSKSERRKVRKQWREEQRAASS